MVVQYFTGGFLMKRALVLLLVSLSLGLLADWYSIDERTSTQLFEVKEDHTNTTTLQFSLDGFELSTEEKNGTTFTRINYQDEGEFLDTGKPDLPRFTRMIIIPNQGKVNITTTQKTSFVLENITPFPKQPLQSESNPTRAAFTIDEEYYNSSQLFPTQIAQLNEPAIMRDYRIVAVTVNPFQYNPATNSLEVISELELTVTTDSRPGVNEKLTIPNPTRAFDKLYKSSLLNYSSRNTRDEFAPSNYLFIHKNNASISPLIQDLAQWKHEKGFLVTVANTSETGTGSSSIKSYIQNAYNSWENPPEYICIVGDAYGTYGIPPGYMGSGEGDHYYTTLDGNDILADAIIGRLSCSSTFELQTIISKIYYYEKDVFTEVDHWYDEAFVLGDPTASGTSVIDTKRSTKEVMNNFAPNINVSENYEGNWVNSIVSHFNSGISAFNYRGFGGMSGFGHSDIEAMNNGRMLPFAVLITCNTGSFASETSLTEQFLKVGSPANYSGAIGAIGTATGETHTCFNNCVDLGIFKGMYQDRITTMGGALLSGKLHLYNNYPQNPSGQVDNFSYWNNLMGDPGLEIFTAKPIELIVNHLNEIPVGTRNFSVSVTDDSNNPIEDVQITLLQGDDLIFATKHSDASGNVSFEIDAQEVGEFTVTATKHNHITYQTTSQISNTPSYLDYTSISIDDDNLGNSSGNENGVGNSGENIELTLDLKNYGSSTITNINTVLSTDNPVVVISSQSSNYDDLPLDGQSSNLDPFVINISENIWNSASVEFNLEVSGTGFNQNILFNLVFEGPGFAIEEITTSTTPIAPGAETELIFSISNLGSTRADNITAELTTESSILEIIDGTGSFGDIEPGTTNSNTENSFIIMADASTVPGTQVPVTLVLNGVQDTPYLINTVLDIGTVSITTPQIPDVFGHSIYDDGDVDYLECPVYNWIEIDPNYGGSGISLELQDIGNTGSITDILLPFTLTFYGIDYNEMTVCSNGWVAPGDTDNTDFMNWLIPSPGGPSPMIAPFWDDLKTSYGNVYSYYDVTMNIYIIQWSRMKNEHSDNEETFQVIFYDKYDYPTINGDNKIVFQYHTINNDDVGSYGGYHVAHGAYATVGIEDHTGSHGMLYTFNNNYPATARPLQNEMALSISDSFVLVDEPYLVISDLVIDDENGVADYAETVNFYLELRNMGLQDATDISVEISCDSEYITMDQPYTNYTTIAGNSLGTNQTPLTFTVAADVPDQYISTLDIEIVYNQFTRTYYYPITISAPLLHLENFSVQDGNNGTLDPGESCSVILNFRNIGHTNLNGANIQISGSNEHVTYTEFSEEDIDISVDEAYLVEIPVEVSILAPISSLAYFNTQFNNTLSYSQLIPYYTYVGIIPVNYSSDFSNYPNGWTISGGSNWELTNTNQAGGTAPEMQFRYSPGPNSIQRLTSPIINTLGSNTLNLKFQHMLNDFNGDYSARIETTSDGINWNTVYEFPSDNIDQTLAEFTIDTEDVGSQTFQVAWVYDGDPFNINYWHVDDVELFNSQTGGYGYVQGVVSLESGPGNVTEIEITAGNITTNPTENGEFIMVLPVGEYEISFSLEGYFEQVFENIVISSYQQVFLNCAMVEWFPFYPPSNLQSELEQNNITLSWENPVQESPDQEVRIQELSVSELSISEISVKKNLVQEASPSEETASLKQHAKLSIKEQSSNPQIYNREMNSFNLYRNSELLANIGELTTTAYNDINLPAGSYIYWLTTVYDEGESTPSESVQIDIMMPEPVNFTAEISNHDILLSWDAPTTEIDITGYEIYRNNQLLDEVEINHFSDHPAESGTFSYFLKTKYGDYQSSPSDTLSIDFTDLEPIEIPLVTKLLGNYPNPFNPVTTISFSLHQDQSVKLFIYDVKGRIVRKLIDTSLPAQNHKVTWDGTDEVGNSVASGIYFYQLRTAEYSKDMKLLLLK